MINIFVVDLAVGSARGIRKLLPDAGVTGFKTYFATSYRDILEGFRGKNYDVCLIDSASGNGPRLFAQARSLGCAAPVILVTTNDAREAVNALRSGVADCLVRDDMTAAGVERSICCVVAQAQASARQSERERRYLALIDNADEMIFTHGLKGSFTSMNATSEQVTGYSQEEWLSLNVSQIVGPEFHDVVQQMIQQTLDARRQTIHEIEIVTKQGQKVLIEVGLHLIYHQGKAVEVQWIARELSVSKQSVAALMRNAQIHGADDICVHSLPA